MDGKLLVLCDERPTIDEWENPIDQRGNILNKCDECKRVINGLDLMNPMQTDSTDTDIIYADWETIVTSQIEPLMQMKQYAFSQESLPPKLLMENAVDKSLMQKSYFDTLLQLDKSGERPRIDYGMLAMETFLNTFCNAISMNRILSIYPTFSENQDKKVISARMNILGAIGYKNKFRANKHQERIVNILNPIIYKKYGEVVSKAKDEILKIYNMPEFFKETEDDELEGRD